MQRLDDPTRSFRVRVVVIWSNSEVPGTVALVSLEKIQTMGDGFEKVEISPLRGYVDSSECNSNSDVGSDSQLLRIYAV